MAEFHSKEDVDQIPLKTHDIVGESELIHIKQDNSNDEENKENDYNNNNNNNENNEIKNDKDEEKVPNYGGLWKIHKTYGTIYWLPFTLGCLWSLINGAVLPFFAVAFRKVLEVLSVNETNPNRNLQDDAITCLWYFMVIGVGSFVGTTLQFYYWGIYGTRISIICRKLYFDTLLKQEISYHEKETSSAINTKITSECFAIQEALSTKMGFFLQQVSTFIVGIVIAFIYSWQLTLILFACIPVLTLVGVLQAKLFLAQGGGAVDPFSKTGKLSQESLTNIRIVIAFPELIKSKLKEFDILCQTATKKEKKRQFKLGFSVGFFMFGMLAVMYPVALYAGAVLVKKGTISVGDLFGAFFAFFIGGMGLGQSGSVTGDISKGQNASNKLFDIMNRKPLLKEPENTIVIENNNNKETNKLRGEIEFKNVCFSYPSDPTKLILNNINFKIKTGTSLAIVGPSGSGKSTVISLLERYYDINSGDIFIDNEKIHNYNIENLRNNIGLVSQMPLLFDDTIENNIKAGLNQYNIDDIKRACQMANCDTFIEKLPNQYQTKVGEMGTRMSGGQRQRIAIARALLRKPSILLFDEATSALDSKSEHEVQQAINQISNNKSHTMIIIAHRLSTIINCDHIVVIVNGIIVEQGNHYNLMKQNGVYSTLVKSQELIHEHKLQKQKTQPSQLSYQRSQPSQLSFKKSDPNKPDYH